MEAVVRFLLQHPAAAMHLRRGLEDPATPATNDDMVNEMQMEGSLTDARCVEAFRQVDRIHFAPDSEKASAYAPMPLREGTIHLSAPSIYAEASQSLMPITPGMSFLNIGSGTGYFNSVIASLLYSEPYISTNHGIEIWPQTISYCQEKVKLFPHAVNCEFFQGNIYELDVKNSMMYDRIYVGACASSKSKYLYELLEVGGILVGPFQTSTGAQQLRRVTRVSQREFRTEVLKSVSFASLVEPDYNLSDDHRQFTYTLPERPWSTERHATFPLSFREAVLTTLLSVRTSSLLPILPKEIWIQHIFHWCRRHWFDVDTRNNSSHKASRKSVLSASLMSPVEKKPKIEAPLAQARKLDSTPARSPASSSSKRTNISADVAAEPPLAPGLSAPSSSRGPSSSVPPALRTESTLLPDSESPFFRASGASSYSGSVSAPTTTFPTEVPTTLPTDVSTSSGAEIDDSDVNRGTWTEPPENLASSPSDDSSSVHDHAKVENQSESENPDEGEHQEEAEYEGIVEVFEDGRRHFIGQADDPDDLVPDDMATLVGGMIPIEMAHFIALAAQEREDRRRREARRDTPEDTGDGNSVSNRESASDDEDVNAAQQTFGYFYHLGDSDSESADELMQDPLEEAQQDTDSQVTTQEEMSDAPDAVPENGMSDAPDAMPEIVMNDTAHAVPENGMSDADAPAEPSQHIPLCATTARPEVVEVTEAGEDIHMTTPETDFAPEEL